MKLNKKIFSSLIALSIMAVSSFSAFAAVLESSVDEESGMVFIDSFITREELRANYKPAEPVINVEKLDNATMSSVDAVYNNQYGKKKDETTGEYLYDIYRITVTIANVGDLALGYADDQQGIGLYGVAVEGTFTEDVDQVASKIKSCSLAGMTNSSMIKDNSFYLVSNAASMSDPYPFWGSEQLGTKVDDITIEMVCLLVLNAGDAINVTLDSTRTLVNYVHFATPTLVNQEETRPVVSEIKFAVGSSDIDYTAVSTLSDAAKEQITTNFPGKNYYVAGTPIVFEGSATAKYIYATDGTNTKKSPKSIQEYLNIGDGVGATIIPVIVTANATGPAITFSVAE